MEKLRIPDGAPLVPGRRLPLRPAGRELYEITAIDPWFLTNIRQIHRDEDELKTARHVFGKRSPELRDTLKKAKGIRLFRPHARRFWGVTEEEIRKLRISMDIIPVFKRVDTCAAEFVAYTPTLLHLRRGVRGRTNGQKKIIILGGGPNRIGQGIEFDYCWCTACSPWPGRIRGPSWQLQSGDGLHRHDMLGPLYFEPLTFEDVLNIVERKSRTGSSLQFGGQTPLKLAVPWKRPGSPLSEPHPTP